MTTIESDLLAQEREAVSKEVCPKCRGYNVERQWCDLCDGTGVVDPRPVTAQDYADLLTGQDKLQLATTSRRRMTTKDLEQQTRTLIAKWRASASQAQALDAASETTRFSDCASGMSLCADELEALLEKHDE